MNNYYNLTPLQEQILKVVANSANYHPFIYGIATNGEQMHFQTLDARKVTIAVSKLFKEPLRIYTVELFIKDVWILETRYYRGLKQLTDFDLCDIPNKRRNAKFIM